MNKIIVLGIGLLIYPMITLATLSCEGFKNKEDCAKQEQKVEKAQDKTIKDPVILVTPNGSRIVPRSEVKTPPTNIDNRVPAGR